MPLLVAWQSRELSDAGLAGRNALVHAPKRVIPDEPTSRIRFGDRDVRLTNLDKLFWKKLGITKRDLLQYYADISPWLLPHLADRAMVMKRYPNGAEGDFFYMKRAPAPRPEWIEICSIMHSEMVHFPIVQDLPSLLWLINLGCIDLNPWYARCDDTDRPDFLHFDLDPGPGADFDKVREVALHVRDILGALKMPTYAKTTGSKGIHVYVPIVRGPTAERGVDVREGDRHRARGAPPDDHHRRVPQGEAPARPRARRLQPERVGPHAGVDLLGAPDAASPACRRR